MLKSAVTVICSLAVGLLAVPVIVGGDHPATAGVFCGELDTILDTIRGLESGGRYDVPPNRGNASGAYQFIPSTWANHGGYRHAYQAPPDVQDTKAIEMVQHILDRHGGDVAAVPVGWYWPRAFDHPAEMDRVPMPAAGNTLTLRQYQQRWLALYTEKSAAGADPNQCAAHVDPSGYALPIPKAFFDTDPTMATQPHHDYPASDLIVPTGTPIYAMRGGTIARITTWPHNCWELGRCDEPCGIGLSINGDDGQRWIYCHATTLAPNLHLGDPVTTGQYIAQVGNTGRSGTPHLHLEIRLNGQRRPPQPLLARLTEPAQPGLQSARQATLCQRNREARVPRTGPSPVPDANPRSHMPRSDIHCSI